MVARTRSSPVLPVPIDWVEAIEGEVSRQVWAMIRLQLLTGMRPGEVVTSIVTLMSGNTSRRVTRRNIGGASVTSFLARLSPNSSKTIPTRSCSHRLKPVMSSTVGGARIVSRRSCKVSVLVVQRRNHAGARESCTRWWCVGLPFAVSANGRTFSTRFAISSGLLAISRISAVALQPVPSTYDSHVALSPCSVCGWRIRTTDRFGCTPPAAVASCTI